MVKARRPADQMTVDPKSVIALDNISKSYGSVAVLDGVSLSVPGAAYVALCGASGAGKTTLLGILGLLEAPTSGDYRFRGESTRALGDRQLAELRNRAFGFVFQQFSLIPGLSAWQNVARPLTFARVPRREHKRRALELLERLGLAARAEHRPSQLSGGEQQRVAIARALITDPEVILADEPTGNLPPEQWGPILDAFDLLHEAGKTIILVTHNPAVAERASSVLWLRAGKLAQDVAPRNPVGGSTSGATEPLAPTAGAGSEEAGVLLEFLGGAQVKTHGEEVRIPPRLMDILAMLVANPHGLTGEQLLLLVYGEDGRSGTLKSALSKLRRVVPIRSRPYRLETGLTADFIRLEDALAKGDVAAALALYGGSLLPQSEAPGVTVLRERLDSAIRRAVLELGEGNLTWRLAQTLGGDLEVWEAAVEQLAESDPRRTLAAVHAEQLRAEWQ